MAETLVDYAVEDIVKLLIEEAQSPHGVTDQLQQLHLELIRMRAFLRDVDARQHESEIVKAWISQVRHLTFEANDLIERYAFKAASRRRKGIRSILKRWVCIFKECYDIHTTKARMQILNARISDLNNSFRDYGIRELIERDEASSSSFQHLRRTYSHVIEDEFVGLDREIELIVDRLVTENENHHYRVVSIYEMGGLGKSTLAKKVYNHYRVKQYFDGLVWVCISQNWQTEDILRQILIKLIPEKKEEIRKWRNEELVSRLFQIQQSKKYLLVLDDIWSVHAWESIRQVFPVREDGTKILLTTRNKKVAEQIDPNGFHHQLRLLSDDDCWELLRMKALRKRSCQGDNEETQKFEKLGKEMVKECGSLPLAVLVIGGILATKRSLNEWEAVYRNINAYLGTVQEILALSYDDLPYKLKPCFLHLSKFDEDCDIDTQLLYPLWIVERTITVEDRIDDEESMMDVAERHLGELVQRCMVQTKFPETPSILNFFGSCRLHKLMRGLSLRKAEEENFFVIRKL